MPYEDGVRPLDINCTRQLIDITRAPLHWDELKVGFGNICRWKVCPVIYPRNGTFGLVGVDDVVGITI
jgi:hypothetical protein